MFRIAFVRIYVINNDLYFEFTFLYTEDDLITNRNVWHYIGDIYFKWQYINN